MSCSIFISVGRTGLNGFCPIFGRCHSSCVLVLWTSTSNCNKYFKWLLFLLRKAQCSAPLGMESGKIKDAQITASSTLAVKTLAHLARLNIAFKAWEPSSNDNKQWIQVDLDKKTVITSIATQGLGCYYNWRCGSIFVTNYKLQYSADGLFFYYYTVPGQNSSKVGHALV